MTKSILIKYSKDQSILNEKSKSNYLYIRKIKFIFKP